MNINYSDSDTVWINDTIEKHAIDMLLRRKEHDGDFKIWDIVQATARQDMREATDYVAQSTAGGVAARIRYWESTTRDFYVRDFTIRGRARNGGRTEIDKLRDGLVDWYLYGWRNEHNVPDEYIVIDLGVVLKAGLYDRCNEQRFKLNKDNVTGFHWLTIAELESVGALVANTAVVRRPRVYMPQLPPKPKITAAEIAERKKECDALDALEKWNQSALSW